MKRSGLFSRLVGIAAVSAMLTTAVLPSELLVASAAAGKSDGSVTGSVPDAETETAPKAAGKVYYVDSQTDVAEGERDGSKDKPFQTLAEVNAIELQPGDGISLKCGSVFQNQKLAPKGKGTEDKPIVIDSYGEGERPVIHAGGFKKVDGQYVGNKEAVLIENMEYVWVTGLEVTNDDDFSSNWRSSSRGENVDLEYPRRLGIHVTIDSRAKDTYKTVAGDETSRVYKGIVIDDCYIHDVDGNEERKVNKVDGGIGVEIISNSNEGLYPYFDGVTLQNNRIDKCDRTGIKLVRISDLKNFYDPDDPNCDVDYNGANDNSRYNGVRYHDQASRNVKVIGNYVSDVGGDGILICESQGALVEHNILDGNAMRVSSGNANAGIWQWNSFDTTFRYNESFHGPDYNQDGCSFDSDYWSAGTIFEYNYSHDVPMGFMLLMGGNDTDIIRYNLSQNDGVAWRHGAGGANSPSYIYNNVFYYDGANWLYNHSNNNGVAMGNSGNWEMYNNIYYNYNADTVSKWSSKSGTEGSAGDWSNNKLGGNLVYEASGKHSPGEIPGAIQAGPDDKIFVNPGGAEGDEVQKDDRNWSTNWESLKAYALTEDSPARNAGVYVDVQPQATGVNKGLWDSERDRNAAGDFFGNPLYDGSPDIGIIEMSNEDSQTEYPLESNAIYSIMDTGSKSYLTADGTAASMTAAGSRFVLENAKDGYKIRIWNVDDSAYYYLGQEDGAVKFTTDDSTVWKLTDLHNGLYTLSLNGKNLSCGKDGALSLVPQEVKAGADGWYFKKQAQSKSYNVGGGEIPGFSADRKYNAADKLSGSVTEDLESLKGSGEDVYATGVTGETIEYKLYADNEANNLKLYVSEMENVKGRTFDVIVNGQTAVERYTLSGKTDVIELADVYPADGVITVKLQSAYSEAANAMTNPILNGIAADSAPMGQVNMRIDAGNTDTGNMANHDGLYQDAVFAEDGKSGYYEIDGKKTNTVNAELLGAKPVPDGGMGTALKSGRAGENFGYKFKVSPGQYRVKLYFNDTSTDDFTPGSFDVSVNGETVKKDFNIQEAAGGTDKAVDITKAAQARDGLVDIQFRAKSGEKALVNAVVVEPYTSVDQPNLVTEETVSSDAQEAESMKASYAADQNQSTRWSSGGGAGHWIQADLGKKYMVNAVMADWTPGAYATNYRIEVSDGSDSWTAVKSVTGAYPGLNLVEFDPVEAQKVRIVAEAYNDQWGMSMTEFGVYGEEVAGAATVKTDTKQSENGDYLVDVQLENIYQKYRNVMVSFTYDASKMTLDHKEASLNDAALLKAGEASQTDNEDGTRTVTFTYGLKDQTAFKKMADVMSGAFSVQGDAARSEVKVEVTFTNAEGHTTTLDPAKAYVPNVFTYSELTALITEAQAILSNAEAGSIPGTYPQDAIDALVAAVENAGQVGEDQESAVYEQTFLALENAINVFKESENGTLYHTYHKDFSNPKETAPVTSAGTGTVENGAWNLQLGAGQVAKITDAVPLDNGYYYARLKMNDIGDQTLFSILGEDGTRRIRTGWEASHWFWDGALNNWGEWGGGDNLAANQEFEIMMKFDSSQGNTTPSTLWINGNKVSDRAPSYTSGTGYPAFETRRIAKTFSIEELYFTNSEPVTIHVETQGKGSVNQTGDVTSFVEANKTFYFTPEEGQKVESVKVDGQEVGWNEENHSYTFTYLQTDHTMEVTFSGEEQPQPGETTSYHADYMTDTEAQFAGDRTTSAVADQSLTITAQGWGDKSHDGSPAVALDQKAPQLDSGTFYTRFQVNSQEEKPGIGKDQVLFDVKSADGSMIRIGFDYVSEESTKGNWFYDKAQSGAGWGNFPSGEGVAPLAENEDHTLKLEFQKVAEDTYNLHLTVDGQDMGTVQNVKYNDAEGTYGFGARRTAKNYTVKEVYYGNAEEYQIAVNAGEGGTVSQTGNVTVFGKTNKTLFVTPDEGYTVDTVTANGEPVKLAEGGQYTFMNISDNQTFEVTFKEITAEVHKEDLQKLYDLYKNLENNGVYTEESWNAFRNAVDGAAQILQSQAADQKAVDEAKTALENAYQGLEKVPEIPVDKTNLQNLCNQYADMEQGNYTDESWAKLQEALALAQKVLADDSADADAVSAAEKAIQDAVQGLAEKPAPEPADKTRLQQIFNENLNRTETDYTVDSWNVFAEALAQADAVLKDDKAEQSTVDQMYDLLKAAAEQLALRPQEPEKVDKSELQSLFEQAVSKNQAIYTADSWNAFQKALTAANAVLQDKNAAKEQVDNAKEALEAAMNNLVEKSEGASGNGQNTNKPASGNGAANGSVQTGGKNAARTGDESNLPLTAGICVLALAAAGGVLWIRKRR